MLRYYLSIFLLFILVLNSQAQVKQKIYLTNGKVIEGVILEQKGDSVAVETDFGKIIVEKSKIAKIEFKKSVLQDTEVQKKNSVNTLGKSFIYQSRKKNVGVAIGLQTVGAGLLYTEHYVLGTIMMLIEDGLVIGGLSANKINVHKTLLISGIGLKTLNTIFTIIAVNSYNNKLAAELGLVEKRKTKIKITKYRESGNSIFLTIGNGGLGGINFEYRINKSNILNPSLSSVLVDPENHGFKLIPSINIIHLFGEKNNKFEAGAGIGIYPNLNFNLGYRYQKKDGFLFRAGLSSRIFLSTIQSLIGPYISLGYSW